MRQFISIAANTFMELVRQPVFLLLMTASAGFSVFLAAVPYFGFGDDPKMVKDSTLAVMLLSGLFGAVVSASASVGRELRQGTALAVLSKPVSRTGFLLAKYFGLAGALTLLTYTNLVATLLASRMAYDAYGDIDKSALGVFFGLLVLAYLIGGLSNFFLRRPFVTDAVLAVVVCVTVALLIIHFLLEKKLNYTDVRDIDWRLVPAAVLVLFALWVLAGLALACSTRLDMIPTLAVCTGVFLLGLMSDYLFGQRAEGPWRAGNLQEEITSGPYSASQKEVLRTLLAAHDANKDGRLAQAEVEAISVSERGALAQAGLTGVWWASALYTVVPNWQLFWLADVLEGKPGSEVQTVEGFTRRNAVPWSYVLKAFAYTVGYVGATLALGLVLFENRELS